MGRSIALTTALPRFRIACFGLLVVFALILPASATEPQVELNGWRLQQFVKAMDSTYGEPYKVIVEGGITSRVHFIDEQAYMVAGATDTFPNHIATLQLTGISAKPIPFLGLQLGDPEEKVISVLGTPDTRVRIEDWKVTRYDYPGRNYSVELDDAGKLYSIRIISDASVTSAIADDAFSPWAEFADALASRDTARILDQLRPDIEIYRHGRILDIDRRFRDFAENPDADFMSALVGESGLLEAIADVRPDELVRVTEKMGVGLVFAFPADSTLEEIVFFPYAGRYRVYEIAFREPTGKRILGARPPGRLPPQGG